MDTIQNARSASPSAEAEIPRQFLCHITQRLMLEPVTGPDGFSYERDAWEAHERASLRALRSPITRALLPRNRAVPNHNLRSLIAEHPAAQEELRELLLERAIETPLPRTLWEAVAARAQGEVAGVLALAEGAAHDAWQVVSTRPARAVALPFATVGGGFAGASVGIAVGGFVGTWVLPNAGPSGLLGVGLRAPETAAVELVAHLGSRLGMLYGLWYGGRVGLGYDAPLVALKRGAWHGLAVCLGGLGAWLGMVLGFMVRPVACFTLGTCDVYGGGRDTRLLVATLGAVVGAALGLAFGLGNARDWERQLVTGNTGGRRRG